MVAQASSKAGNFERLETSSGLEVFVLPTRKFKTKLLRMHLRAELSQENARRALVPNLLRRGTRLLPTMVDVSRALEGLYGTIWSSSIYKLGNEQILSFRLETVEERYLPGKPAIFEPALAVAHDLVFDTRLVDGTFPADVFAQEQLNHKRDVEAQYNDKMSWAYQRLLDTMFPGEPYGQPVLGTVAATEQITPADAFETWQRLLNEMPARIFAVGDFEPAAVVALVEKHFPVARRAPRALPRRPPPVHQGGPRVVVEKDQLSQSKLVSGRLVDLTDLNERAFDALRVYAGVLGGGFHSRLFQSVREKHSLAYFASASLDRLRGVLFTSCGIDAQARDRCSALIEQEIASLQEAPPRDDELEQTKRLIISSSRSMFDSAGGMVETLEAGIATGRVRTLDEVCRSVAAITAQDVQQAAQRIGPSEVIYCLEGEPTRPPTAPPAPAKGS
jgi:predicted Zn-dependent peptidase